MWNPFAKRTADIITTDLRQHLVARGMAGPVADRVRVAHRHGQYAGRGVTFFRVYDPDVAAPGRGDVLRFDELKQADVMEAGWTETDGAVKFYGHELKGYETKPAHA